MTMRRRLLIFGLTFVTTMLGLSTARAQDYVIGPRDLLKITVWGHDDLSSEYSVDQGGFVAFPLVGRVKASGLTTKELATRLAEVLEKDYLVNPQVIILVKEYLSKKVHVFGQAERPGLFYLTGPTTLLEVLSKAGGLSKSAGKQIVLVRHQRPVDGGPNGRTLLRLNLDKIQAGDAVENILLEDEDTIFVPKAQAYFVLGEVKSAGTFALDRVTSVLEAVTLAGGFSDKAAPSNVKLIRQAPDGTQETRALDLSGSVPKDRMIPVQEGDTILVPRGNTFFVFGQVRRPGAYQLDKETNILEGITIAGGFNEWATPGRTRVIRAGATGEQRVINVDMNDVLRRGQLDKAIKLQENDVVVVP